MCAIIWAAIWAWPVWWVYEHIVPFYFEGPHIPVFWAFLFNLALSLIPRPSFNFHQKENQ